MKPNETIYRITGIAGLLLLLSGVLWAQDKSRSRASAPLTPPAQEVAVDMASASEAVPHPSGQLEDGVRIVEVDAFQYRFDPDPLVVRAGERVRLLLKSRDVAHGIMIPDVDFSTDIPTDVRKPAEFSAPSVPGEYPVFCSVFCGPEHGDMQGRLLVLPAIQE